MVKIKVTSRELFWNYLGYFVSFGINILMLPFVLRYLPSSELGLWYVFISVGGLVSLFDFGFAPQISRMISYAFSGAKEIIKEGLLTIDNVDEDNTNLLSSVYYSSKLLYLVIALIAIAIMMTGGTYYIYSISEFFFSYEILFSWIIFSTGVFLNLKFTYLNSFLRGIGEFKLLNKAQLLSKSIQLLLSLLLLFLGYGILAVSLSYLFGSLIFRGFLFLKFNSILNNYSITLINRSFSERVSYFKVIWFNAWREGMITFSKFLTTQSNTIICSLYFGLNLTASFALSVQIVSFISAISTVSFTTYLPMLNEASLKNDLEQKKKIFSYTWSGFFVSYVLLIVLFVFAGKHILSMVDSKTDINIVVFILLSVHVFFETNYFLSSSYISTSNTLPYAKPFLISSVFSVILSFVFAEFTHFGVYGLIIALLVSQSLYNMWKWPLVVFREIKSNPIKMMLNSINFLLSRFR